eukprot:XP_002935697.1 PREDICTED: uncharacterized protein LOC100490651 isoform X1 [Xenopus tropicalis]
MSHSTNTHNPTMDSGHHTPYLLAILLCILLLLVALSTLLVCYWRKKCFKNKKWKIPKKTRGLVKDQATSMTSFTLHVTDPKSHIYRGQNISNVCPSFPLMVDHSCQKPSRPSSFLSLDGQSLGVNEDFCLNTLDPTVGENGKAVQQSSVLHYAMSSGASLLSSILDNSLYVLKSKRRSSSLKSGLDPETLMVPLESPVKETSSSGTSQFRALSLPRDLDRSTLLCDNSVDQQFTWDTLGLSNLSHPAGHKESISVPGTLERNAHSSEDPKKQDFLQLQKPFPIQPMAWFVSFGNRPFSGGFQVGKVDINNVTSLDSGVDIIEIPVRKECDGLFKSDPSKTSCSGRMESCTTRQEPQEITDHRETNVHINKPLGNRVHISHQEAARRVNGEYCGKSPWQKREDRPLIGIN